MKSVMISIKPKWCQLIASGKKTVEVRKTRPKIETPFKCYIYCTAQKHGVKDLLEIHSSEGEIHKANGKVIGKFICDRFDEITTVDTPVMEYIQVNGKASITITDDTCLEIDALSKYANGKTLYGWHISDLVIYDVPRELSEFVVNDKMAIKTCRHRIRWGQPESVTQHGGWIKGGYCCTRYSEPVSCEPVFCENYITKPVSRPPQSWCYVEEKK